MSKTITFCLNNASEKKIVEHLSFCDADFVPPLSDRVDIISYAQKIRNKAMRFEAWSDNTLIGLVAVYCNDQVQPFAYITNVSVLIEWTGKGIASKLLQRCINYVKELQFERIELEVDSKNLRSIKLYEQLGFIKNGQSDQVEIMHLEIRKKDEMRNKRDYNSEIKDSVDHQYAYSFDFDVMHPYMLKSFKPFFNKGKLLELGSYKGDFTKRFLPYFDDVTCVEASNIALAEAKRRLGDRVTFVNSLFEKASLPKKYDNIVLTHVLEHLDDPVLVLKRINYEWLAENGRLFLVCPNANAPSRQIAVKMGLISHNSAVTPAEAKHGHQRTYALDILERDAVAAGLRVVHRTGIFFKAFANFQWDQIIGTPVISTEYLDGCYQLGQQYPDLCSSIFLLCERGENEQ